MFNRIMLLLLPVVLAAAGYGAWRLLDSPLQRFVVRGDLSAMEQSSVHTRLAALHSRGILSTDLADVADALRALPWARAISVRRQWPDAMVITLQRAQPIARWGEARYLSAAGELMTLPDEYLGLPRFDVAVENPLKTLGVYRLLDQILVRAGLRISRLAQNQQGEWQVDVKAYDGTATGTVTVLLGGERLNERAHRFLLLQRQVLAATDESVAYVDARYASGLAVRYQPRPGGAGDAGLAANLSNTGGASDGR